MDYILNGQAHGSVASTLINNGFNTGVLRPWIGRDGRHYVTVNENGKQVNKLVSNATATLRKDDWIIIDEAIQRAARPRLRAVADLRGNNLQFNIPDGMGRTVLQTESMSDISPAQLSMDGLRKSEADRPEFELKNLPLPIIHKDFDFSAREISTSRNGGSPIDTSSAELAGQRVAEMAENLLIGNFPDGTGTKYGGGEIFGYKNFPQRITRTITDPSGTWTPSDTINEVLAMKNDSQKAFYFGPWRLYCSPDWDQYMDNDYNDNKGDRTLRERIEAINGIQEVRTLDFLSGFDLILVQMTSNVVREVIGMDITTVQWEEQGGMLQKFKVMAIMVPQIRADFNGNTGIVHGSI